MKKDFYIKNFNAAKIKMGDDYITVSIKDIDFGEELVAQINEEHFKYIYQEYILIKTDDNFKLYIPFKDVRFFYIPKNNEDYYIPTNQSKLVNCINKKEWLNN